MAKQTLNKAVGQAEQECSFSATTIAALLFLAAKFPHRQFNSSELCVLSGIGRSAQGVGAFYTHPEHLADETIEVYFRPFAESKLKRTQLNKFSIAMATNPLVAIRDDLKRWKDRPAWSGARTIPFSGCNGPSGSTALCLARAESGESKGRTCFSRRKCRS
jgi:hypothetical protein